MTSPYHCCCSGIVAYPFIQAFVSSFDIPNGHFTSFICFYAIFNCAQFNRLEFIFEPARSKRANSEVNQCVNQSNPVNTETEGAIESSRINKVDVGVSL